MIIPKEVEQKIRQTCNEIRDTEWSGILFYDYEGSFEEDNLVIKCIDFLLMDIGTSTYTEFNDSRDTLDYAEKHPELYDHLHMQALVHSHNHMNTFFSGTDISTLQEWGAERNNFVSLIVNNEGTYTAAITRKVSSHRQVKETFFTKFFGEGDRTGNREYEEEVTERLEYFLLEIEKEESDEGKETHERIEEIRERKRVSSRTSKTYTISSSPTSISFTPASSNSSKYSAYNNPRRDERSLFDNDPLYGYYDSYGSDFDIDPDDDIPIFPKVENSPINKKKKRLHMPKASTDPEVIKGLVFQIITGSIVLSSKSKIDLQKWVKMMPALYDKRFGGLDAVLGTSEMFKEWAEMYLEFLLTWTTDPKLKELGYNDSEIWKIISQDLVEALRKLEPNAYISEFINQIEIFTYDD